MRHYFPPNKVKIYKMFLRSKVHFASYVFFCDALKLFLNSLSKPLPSAFRLLVLLVLPERYSKLHYNEIHDALKRESTSVMDKVSACQFGVKN